MIQETLSSGGVPAALRPGGRAVDELRPMHIQRRFTRHAEGSVLIELGDTRVLCNASVEHSVPRFLRGEGRGWVTAEYALLPRSTDTRTTRESVRGRQTGRSQEIQRLIGRSLRAMLDLSLLGENTIIVDCDVLQADGGTRTAAVNGACVAVMDAVNYLTRRGKISTDPVKHLVAAVSVGVCQGEVVLDLDYAEDSQAQTDMNVVLAEGGGFIEIQGTAEAGAFSDPQLATMLDFARRGAQRIFARQRAALAD